MPSHFAFPQAPSTLPSTKCQTLNTLLRHVQASEVSAAAQVLHLEGSWKGSLPAGSPRTCARDTVTSSTLPPAAPACSQPLRSGPPQTFAKIPSSWRWQQGFVLPRGAGWPQNLSHPRQQRPRMPWCWRPPRSPAGDPRAPGAVPPLSPRALLPPAGHPEPSTGSGTAGEPREPLSPKAGLAERLCHQLWGRAGTPGTGSCPLLGFCGFGCLARPSPNAA